AISALALSIFIFWKSRDRAIQGAALCAATLLVSPYMFFYDFPLLLVGAAMLGAPRTRFEIISLVFAWAAGLSLPLGYVQPAPLCPLAAWLVLLAAALRVSAEAYPTRKAQAPAR